MMPYSKNRENYIDCEKFFDAVAEAGSKGRRFRKEFVTPGQAFNFRSRCFALRALERRESARMYPPGDPMRGASAYDAIHLILEDVYVIGEVRSTLIVEGEEID
jgi:hypothetical protein